MAEPRNTAGAKSVQAALRKSIEINLAREKALSGLRIPGGVSSWHSNGVIFSKSGNGTPFSNGLIFSKTGAGERDDFTTREGHQADHGGHQPRHRSLTGSGVGLDPGPDHAAHDAR